MYKRTRKQLREDAAACADEHDKLLAWRYIEDDDYVCPACDGRGVRKEYYPHSTWLLFCGRAVSFVCDRCKGRGIDPRVKENPDGSGSAPSDNAS